MTNNVKMICPNCRTQISVDELLVSQFQQSIKKDLEAELAKRETAFRTEKEEFKKLSLQLSKDKESVDDLVSKKVKALLHAKEVALKETIRAEINEERSQQFQELENELTIKSAQLKELNATKAQLERLRREMQEKESAIVLQKEKEFTERLEQTRLSIKERAHQEHLLKLREREKVIDDLKKKLDEAKQKAEQGSMQLQGYVQEMELLTILQEFHPLDDISKSKTGTNAADILQVVRTQNGSVCGSIYYESKRTTSSGWSRKWIDKLKQDSINMKTDICVIVSSVLPKGIERYGLIDGVWVCTFQDVKELSLVLRYGLLKVQQVAITKQGKESKMELLYSYLTSNEFKSVFESILEGFKNLRELHQSEEMKAKRYWAQRHKVLEQVLSNSVEFYGSVKAIAGAAIAEIPMLETPRKAG